MAPHPAVQAFIDLSAGAVGKLPYLHFQCILPTLVAALSFFGSHLFRLSSQCQVAPACHLDLDDTVFFQVISLCFYWLWLLFSNLDYKKCFSWKKKLINLFA